MVKPHTENLNFNAIFLYIEKVSWITLVANSFCCGATRFNAFSIHRHIMCTGVAVSEDSTVDKFPICVP